MLYSKAVIVRLLWLIRNYCRYYYGIGKYISENTRKGVWGKNAIEAISEKLPPEYRNVLPDAERLKELL